MAHVFKKRWGRDDGHDRCCSCDNYLRVGENCMIFVNPRTRKARALCMDCLRQIAEVGGLITTKEDQ